MTTSNRSVPLLRWANIASQVIGGASTKPSRAHRSWNILFDGKDTFQCVLRLASQVKAQLIRDNLVLVSQSSKKVDLVPGKSSAMSLDGAVILDHYFDLRIISILLRVQKAPKSRKAPL